MRIFLTFAVLAHAFIGGSCDAYQVLMLDETSNEILMSIDTPQRCTTHNDVAVAKRGDASCVGGKCIDVMPDKKDGLDIGFSPVFVIAEPRLSPVVDWSISTAALAPLLADVLLFETHTETVIMHC